MEETEIICPNCKEEVSQVAIYCEYCKFPVSGTDKEKAIFIGQQTLNKSKVVSSEKVISRTQTILYIVAGFKVLNAVLAYLNFKSVIDAVFFVVIALILAVFSYLLPKKPVLFISLALGVILCYYLLLFLVSPMLLFNGILWKCCILMALFYALYTVVESQKLKKKFNL
ncbi:hypothetical protein [Kordia sp.]|uniref:hypothetical protein n=1 Tax=Kordia sp. TaxID=1965332 RepID=UPI003B5B69A1